MKRLIVLLGAAGISLSAILVRLSTAPSLIMALYRMSFTAILLAPVVLMRNWEELRRLQKRDVLLCLVSGTSLALHFAAYFEALRFTSITSAVVLVDTEVFFVALVSVLVLRQKLPKQAWISIFLTFAGSVVIAMADTAAGSDVLRGDLIALFGAMCMGAYTTIGAVCRRKLTTNTYTFLVYLTASVVLLGIALTTRTPLTGYGAVNYATGLGLAVFCTLLGHSIFSWGLKYLPPAFISTSKLLEPVLASIYGMILFKEVPGILVTAGGVIVICGVALYARITTDET